MKTRCVTYAALLAVRHLGGSVGELAAQGRRTGVDVRRFDKWGGSGQGAPASHRHGGTARARREGSGGA